ncbi:peptidase S8/S53 subtilisin kexin sedolisin [Shewanella sp. Choline-02u-19]|uniref:S8 family serine peptidase n=1 Tax=unclassified Shewanella TaxID=196818 RepID=UPI000C31E5AC|nr:MULTISPECIES: S8 family serine peptidase [unclassified Shewanella]PKH53963.1 peptidase S8/S53 subtilisin kexin sedolisin [Shewanella sp. Bg11-22]PKI30476.1 peptidase S8/S53 subtilisin kexin sedolisin [Shewanella sp. Choline-02u-19]
MKITYKKSLIAAALSIILSPVSQANITDTRGLDVDGGQRSNKLQASKRNTDNLYMVLLDDQPLATYKGGIDNLKATSLLSNNHNKNNKNGTLNVQSAASQHYLQYLAQQSDLTLKRAQASLKRELTIENQYKIALNGFSTTLTEQEVTQLQGVSGVKHVQKVQLRHLTTDSGPRHIQAPSAWDGTATGVATQGEGVIVGILDTGISAFNPSFADIGGDGYDHTNPLGEGVYLGHCADSELANYCNDKLIGIWANDGVLADYVPEGDDVIGIDHNGHGSHTASTTAGNVVKNVPIYNVMGDKADFTFGHISGVAPHANIISYQVCAADAGCWTDVTAQAVEHAIENGVQVLNYSVGGGASDPWYDTDALAFLSAREAGIHVATSAGNSGPGPETVGSPGNAPWITTVAAYTHDRSFTDKEASFTGGDSALTNLSGKGATAGFTASVVHAADYGDADCLNPFDIDTFSGEIVVCQRGDIARVTKGTNVLAGGAGGMILVNVDGGSETVDADFHVLPAIHVDAAQGNELTAWLANGSEHIATITASAIESDPDNADIAAVFTSRGPEPIMNRWLTPHVAAPGVAIYAANSEYQPWREEKTESPYTFMDGTSMSSPHVAGAMALIAALKPAWTPAELQSALMLSAEFNTRKDDGVTASDFFDSGAGSIRISKALNTGLIMNVTNQEYLDANPDLGGKPEEMNMPSAVQQNCMMSCNWTRTFTATSSSTWTTSGDASVDDLTVSATPSSFTLAAGESVTLEVTATISNGFNSEYGMGRLLLTPADAKLTPSAMPVIGTFVAGSFPESTYLVTNKSKGSANIEGITTVGTSDLQIATFELAEVESITTSLPRDDSDTASWPANVYNDSSFFYSQLINVTPNTKRVIVRIKDTTSPDLDIFIGRDANYNGKPDNAMEMDDMLCQSATETAYESCEVNDPQPGSYYVTVHNFGNTSAPSDTIDDLTIEIAVIDKDDSSVTVDYNAQLGANEDIGLVLNWDKDLKPDTLYITALEIGTGPDAASNIGLMPIELYKNATYLTGSVDSERVNTGDMLTLTLELAANASDEEMLFDIQTSIPEGLIIDSDSHMGMLEGQTLSWQVTQAANSELQSIVLVLNTAEQVMSKTLSFDVSHTVNSVSITETVGPVQLEGVPVALINGESAISVTADEQTVVALSAVGSTTPNADDVITYSWAQVSGQDITMDDASSASVNVTLPDVEADSSAVVELTVSNGSKTTVATATIAITAEVVAVEPEPTQSDSGGAMGVSVLLLGLFGLRRRTKKSST